MRFSMFFMQRIVKQNDFISVLSNPTNTYIKSLQEKHKGRLFICKLSGVQIPCARLTTGNPLIATNFGLPPLTLSLFQVVVATEQEEKHKKNWKEVIIRRIFAPEKTKY